MQKKPKNYKIFYLIFIPAAIPYIVTTIFFSENIPGSSFMNDIESVIDQTSTIWLILCYGTSVYGLIKMWMMDYKVWVKVLTTLGTVFVAFFWWTYLTVYFLLSVFS